MAGEWIERPLRELVEIFDGPHATPVKTQAGPIFLGISNLAQGRVNLGEVEHLSEDDYVRWTRRIEPREGDVVFSYETRLGEAARVPSGLRCCLGRRMGLLRARTNEIDERFLLYAYLGPQFQETLRGRTVPGSTVDRIPLIDMPQFPMVVPTDPNEQRAIAHILGTLDDKIELNRRMNETLEAMGRALFRSWFVDFDPVRAKAAGRDPGLPKHIADLFPDSFEDSELGEIPKGWRVCSIGDICQRVAMGPFGSDIKTDNFVESGVPIVRGSNLTDGFVEDSFVYVSEEKAEELRNANAFPGDIVITHRGTLGQVGLIPESSRFPRYVVSQSQMLVSVSQAVATPGYLYEFLRSPSGQHSLLANTSQTGVPAIARPTTSLRGIRLVLPSIELLRIFETVIALYYRRRDNGVKESRTLAALRDVMLPKLISGEIRVPGV